jgi:hypothetical protein
LTAHTYLVVEIHRRIYEIANFMPTPSLSPGVKPLLGTQFAGRRVYRPDVILGAEEVCPLLVVELGQVIGGSSLFVPLPGNLGSADHPRWDFLLPILELFRIPH